MFRSIYISTIIVFLFSLTAFAQTPLTGQVNANEINVRVDSTVSAKVICVLNKSDKVEVVTELYDWYKIRLPKQVPSYLRNDMFECVDPPAAPLVTCRAGKIIKDNVNIRFAPGESSWILGKVDKNTIVNILEITGEWSKIEPIHESYGWVNKKFISKIEENQIPPNPPFWLGLSDAQPLPSGLSKGEIEEVAARNDALFIIEGIIEPYGMVLWRKATHKLITENGKIYLLEGNKKSLDVLLGHKVKISGRLLSPEGKKYPIIGITQVEAIN